jgi:hypothetical protein
MPSYSLQNVILTVGGRRLEAFGESDAIAYKFRNDRLEVVPSSSGSRSVANALLCRDGEVTLTFRYDSTANKVLGDLSHVSDSFSFSGVWPNGMTLNSTDARVMKFPEVSDGAKAGEWVWTLVLMPMELELPAGSP